MFSMHTLTGATLLQLANWARALVERWFYDSLRSVYRALTMRQPPATSIGLDWERALTSRPSGEIDHAWQDRVNVESRMRCVPTLCVRRRCARPGGSSSA